LTETIIKIMAEMFSVVVLTTEEMCQGKLSESLFFINTPDDKMT
jgi:hypothetical protein